METLIYAGQARGCQRITSPSICSVVKLRALQFFLSLATAFFFFATPVRGTLSTGTTYPISFVDIDGNKFSTADGHVTIVVLTTAADREQARTVGDRVPDFCLGNPAYRMITIIHFTRKPTAIGRKLITALAKRRVNEEAKRLQTRYDAKKITRDARTDIFTVIDFDGSASSQLNEPAQSASFRVLVFARDGKLLAQWNDVPSAEQLAEVLTQSH